MAALVLLAAASPGAPTAAGSTGSSGVTWTSVNSGQNHTCSVLANGEGWCWGNNTVGELGTGSTSGSATPQRVAGDHAWQTIDGGDDFTCGLDASGAAWCWGSGWHGQLGNGVLGNSDPVTSPSRVVGGLAFAKIAAGNSGNYHACAITAGGAAYCWGNNTYGQLGNGTTAVPFGSASPVAVVGGHIFSDIAVGRDFTCGITSDAAMWCWGDDEGGQLGDDAGAPGRVVPTPVLVAGGHRWRAVDAGDSHACGVDVEGVAYCWGKDAFGELGLGVAGTSSNVPAAVASSTRFVDIGVGTYNTCAVATTGELWCWGYPWYGGVANGTKNTDVPVATPTRAATSVSFAGDLSGGYLHLCVLGSGGQAYCWGYSGSGELGSQPPELCMTPQGFEIRCSSVPFPVTAPATTGLPLPKLTSVTVSPTTVVGGGSATGTVTLSAAAPQGGAEVALSTSSISATAPASVTVAEGRTSATFTVTTSAVSSVRDAATITAQYNGTSASAQLTIDPAASPPETDTLTVKRAEYTASKRQLRVEVSSTSTEQTLVVYVSSTNERIGTLTGQGSRYSGHFSWPANPQTITIRSSGGSSITASVSAK